jgi:DNA-binding transcriptional MerR regulator
VLKKNKQLFGKVKQALEPLQNTKEWATKEGNRIYNERALVRRNLIKNIRQEELNVKRRVKILRSYNNYLSLKSIKQ